MLLIVEVTSGDIERGRPLKVKGVEQNVCWTCPVARAIRQQVPRGVEFRGCGEFYAHFRFKSVALPAEVTAWIFALDKGETVGPILFELDVPEEAFARKAMVAA